MKRRQETATIYRLPTIGFDVPPEQLYKEALVQYGVTVPVADVAPKYDYGKTPFAQRVVSRIPKWHLPYSRADRHWLKHSVKQNIKDFGYQTTETVYSRAAIASRRIGNFVKRLEKRRSAAIVGALAIAVCVGSYSTSNKSEQALAQAEAPSQTNTLDITTPTETPEFKAALPQLPPNSFQQSAATTEAAKTITITLTHPGDSVWNEVEHIMASKGTPNPIAATANSVAYLRATNPDVTMEQLSEGATPLSLTQAQIEWFSHIDPVTNSQ